MKIAYVTTYDAQDINQWSGTPYHMTQALEAEAIQVSYLGSLTTVPPPSSRMKQLWTRITQGQRESLRFSKAVTQDYAAQVAKKLAQLEVDAIIAPQINPIAYLDCKQPIILWTDALYAALLGFYPPSSHLSALAVKQANQLTAEALSRCSLAIFPSDWAARSAWELYGIRKEKVKVVPFGANIDCQHSLSDIKELLKTRQPEKLKFLFIGREWEIKGGDTVLRVAQALHARGQAVEVDIVGCYPPSQNLPSYINCHGFISKRSPEGRTKLKTLLAKAHFLFVPSRAECFGLVFAEANAFGLPCLTTYVGGISTVVKDNINGMTFSQQAPVEDYCDYLIHLMQNYSQYEALALSSFHEYETRLNWNVATRQVKRLIQEVI